MKSGSRLLTFLLVLAGGAGGAGCDPVPPSHACAAIGLVPGVSYDLTALRLDPTGLDVVGCVGDRCQPARALPDAVQGIIEDDGLTGTGPVPVRVTVTDHASGALRWEGHAEVPLRISTPNGPDCPPSGYVGGVTATADGRLVPA